MRAMIPGLALTALAFAAQAAQPMTVDELMSQQSVFDGASFSPDGHNLLYSARRRDAGSDGLIVPVRGREAWIQNLDTGKRIRVGGVEQGGALPSTCDPWAPDGAGVALLTDRGGLPRLGFYDLRRRRLELFKPLPARTCVNWVGRTLVYEAATAEAPITWSNRQRLAAEATRWEAAWSGRTTEVTVQSNNNHFAAPPNPETGLAFADPASGRSGLIARGDFIALTPSPDGRTLAAIRLGPPDPDALNRFKGRRGELELYRIDGQRGRRLFHLSGYDVGDGGLAWSPDGRQLLVGARALGQQTPGLFIFSLDSHGLASVPLPEKARLTPIQPGILTRFQQLGWIGGRPAFIAGTPGAKGLASDAVKDHGAGESLDFELYVAGTDGVRSLSAFTKQSVMRFATTSDGDGLVAADGALWRLRADGPPQRLTATDVVVTGLAEIAPSMGGPFRPAVAGHRVAIMVRGPDGRGQLMVIDVMADGQPILSLSARDLVGWSPTLRSAAAIHHVGWSGELEVLGDHAGRAATFNPEWRDRPIGQVHAISYQVAGRALRGWVITPPGPRTGRVPAIVWIYGGQLLSNDPPSEATPGQAQTPVFDGQLWAAHGYAVIYPSTPVGPGSNTDVAATLAEAAVAAVDAAAREGWVDRDRVAIAGHSFGGFSTAAVLARRSDRFRAGVAMSGIYDFGQAWGERSASDRLTEGRDSAFGLETLAYVEQGQIGLSAPPWVAVDAYVRSSPLYSVETIRTPLLLTVGDLDLGVTDLSQSERFYAALRRAGNPAVLVRYWGEGHVRYDPAAARDEWRRMKGWLDHYLKGVAAAPPPSPAGGSASSGSTTPPTLPKAPPSAGPPE